MASLRGYLVGIDGRAIMASMNGNTTPVKIGNKTFKNPKGVVTKDSLNRLLQGGAAEVFKRAVQLLNTKSAHLRAESIIYYHDEAQTMVHKDDVDEFISIAADCIRLSGEYYKLRIPIDGEIKVGNNWAETH